jgi:hypothetical protein
VEFKAAKCPSCGGSLQLPDDHDQVLCMYCGSSVIVRQAIQLSIKVDTAGLMKLAEAATAVNNTVEAYRYFSRVLESDATNALAWEGRGRCAFWMQSNMKNFDASALIVGFRKAIENTPESQRPALQERLAVEINRICMGFYEGHMNIIREIQEDQTKDLYFSKYLVQSQLILSALETAHELDETSTTILRNLARICRDNLKGVRLKFLFGWTAPGLRCNDEWGAVLREKLVKYERLLKKLDRSYRIEPIPDSKAWLRNGSR